MTCLPLPRCVCLCAVQLLEENYMFIKAIVDQQNLGRVQEMGQ